MSSLYEKILKAKEEAEAKALKAKEEQRLKEVEKNLASIRQRKLYRQNVIKQWCFILFSCVAAIILFSDNFTQYNEKTLLINFLLIELIFVFISNLITSDIEPFIEIGAGAIGALYGLCMGSLNVSNTTHDAFNGIVTFILIVPLSVVFSGAGGLLIGYVAKKIFA